MLLAPSCDRDDNAEIFPEEYFKVVYIKDSGERDVVMNTAQEVVAEQMLVIKGGAHPEMPADCRLEVMSVADAAAQYGYAEDEIGIIPEGSYKLPGSISLTQETSYQYIEVELFPALMAPAMREKPALAWMLPLRLASDSGSVNKDNCLLRLNCSVVSPFINWASGADQHVNIDYKTLAYHIDLAITKTEISKAAFSGVVEALGEDAVAAYNAGHGTAYPLLPAGSYNMGGISFEANSLNGSALVNLSRNGLTADEEYLLPLRIASVSSNLFELSDEVKYIIIGNPKFAYEEVDPSTWKIAFSNSEDRNSQYWAVNMFNRDPKLGFCSYWNISQQTKTGTDVDDFRWKEHIPAHAPTLPAVWQIPQ